MGRSGGREDFTGKDLRRISEGSVVPPHPAPYAYVKLIRTQEDPE